MPKFLKTHYAIVREIQDLETTWASNIPMTIVTPEMQKKIVAQANHTNIMPSMNDSHNMHNGSSLLLPILAMIILLGFISIFCFYLCQRKVYKSNL